MEGPYETETVLLFSESVMPNNKYMCMTCKTVYIQLYLQIGSHV